MLPRHAWKWGMGEDDPVSMPGDGTATGAVCALTFHGLWPGGQCSWMQTLMHVPATSMQPQVPLQAHGPCRNSTTSSLPHRMWFGAQYSWMQAAEEPWGASKASVLPGLSSVAENHAEAARKLGPADAASAPTDPGTVMFGPCLFKKSCGHAPAWAMRVPGLQVAAHLGAFMVQKCGAWLMSATVSQSRNASLWQQG